MTRRQVPACKTEQDFRDLVRRMRAQQIAYFRAKPKTPARQAAFFTATQLERQVDAELARDNPEHGQPVTGLFQTEMFQEEE